MSKELKIPSTWVQVPFSDLFLDPKNNIVGGPFGSNLKSSEYRTEGIPVFRIQNIDRNKFIDKNINYITKEKAEFLSKHSFKSGDIIITKLGDPLGKTCFVPKKYEKGIIVADLIRARVDNKNINPKFIVYQFNSPFFIKQFDRFTKGTTRPRIKLSVVRELWFNLPPLLEQERIVNVIEELFSDLDNGVQNLTIAQKQLKVYRQALLKYAFEGKLTKQWRDKNKPKSAEKLLEHIEKEREKYYRQELNKWDKKLSAWNKNKEGKKPKKPIQSKIEITLNNTELPATWFTSNFGNSVLNFDGDRVPLSANIRSNRKGNHPYYGATGVIDYVDNYIFDGKYLLIGEDGANLLSKSRDLAFIVNDKFWVNNHAHVVKPHIGMNMEFLCFYFNSLTLNKYVSGTAQPKLSQSNLNNIPVPYCSEEEQSVIVNELEAKFSILNDLEETIIDGISKSEALRHSILKKAFEGKLVDQSSNDEPASHLLKHIEKERKKYLKEQKLDKKKAPKKHSKMSKKLSVLDVLKESKEPMLAKDVWQQSTHHDNIEAFYSELKNIQNSIKEVKKGTQSLLSVAK